MASTIVSTLVILSIVTLTISAPASPQRVDVPTAATPKALNHSILGDIRPAAAGSVSEEIINRRHVPLQNCKELQDYGFTKTGLYVVQPNDNGGEFVVYCDMTLLGGGWTILQRRLNGDLDFNRNFASYRNGFGDFFENFWLGLEKIHRLTKSPNPADSDIELYIGLESFEPETVYARYNNFAVENEDAGYTLRISEYDIKSTAGDSLGTHNGQKFSTKDNDRDLLGRVNCAKLTKGGWWYRDCHDSNLNGVWYEGGTLANSKIPDGVIWQHWMGNSYSVKTVVIAMRPAVH